MHGYISFRLLLGCTIGVGVLGLTGCGGGNGTGGSSALPAESTFTLMVTPATIALSQSGTQEVQVEALSENGFPGQVTVTVTGLPPGVTVSPASVALPIAGATTFGFTAVSNATSGNFKLAVQGVSGSQQTTTTLGLTLIPTTPPIPRPFTTVGGGIERAFYDETRQLLFATNPFLNEVDVLSGNDLSVQARIHVGQPLGIDQMADGKTLIVGTFTQAFYTIDEDTFALTRHVAPNQSQFLTTTVLIIPVAMANGKVLFIGKDLGIESLVTGGQYLIEWDSNTNVFTTIVHSFASPFDINNLKRSAD